MNRAARFVLAVLGAYLMMNGLTNCYLAIAKGTTDKNITDACKDVVIGLLAMLARVGPDASVQPVQVVNPPNARVPTEEAR